MKCTSPQICSLMCEMKMWHKVKAMVIVSPVLSSPLVSSRWSVCTETNGISRSTLSLFQFLLDSCLIRRWKEVCRFPKARRWISRVTSTPFLRPISVGSTEIETNKWKVSARCDVQRRGVSLALLLVYSGIHNGDDVYISSVESSDSGSYECIASNEYHATISRSFYVTIQCKSSDPFSVFNFMFVSLDE